MATIDFINEAKALGYDPQEPSPNKVYFEYTVDVGRNFGKKTLLGFENLQDYPLNCPHGPHFKPIDSGWINPPNGVHASNFGSGWVHWSSSF